MFEIQINDPKGLQLSMMLFPTSDSTRVYIELGENNE